MNLLRCTAIALVGLVVIPLAQVDAGSEGVAFPANFKSGVLYNVVDRDDQKEVHQQYTSHEAIEAAKAGKPLPAGTVITSANYKALLDPQGNPIRDAKGNFVAGELARVVGMQKRLGAGIRRVYGMATGSSLPSRQMASSTLKPLPLRFAWRATSLMTILTM